MIHAYALVTSNTDLVDHLPKKTTMIQHDLSQYPETHSQRWNAGIADITVEPSVTDDLVWIHLESGDAITVFLWEVIDALGLEGDWCRSKIEQMVERNKFLSVEEAERAAYGEMETGEIGWLLGLGYCILDGNGSRRFFSCYPYPDELEKILVHKDHEVKAYRQEQERLPDSIKKRLGW